MLKSALLFFGIFLSFSAFNMEQNDDSEWGVVVTKKKSHAPKASTRGQGRGEVVLRASNSSKRATQPDHDSRAGAHVQVRHDAAPNNMQIVRETAPEHRVVDRLARLIDSAINTKVEGTRLQTPGSVSVALLADGDVVIATKNDLSFDKSVHDEVVKQSFHSVINKLANNTGSKPLTLQNWITRDKGKYNELNKHLLAKNFGEIRRLIREGKHYELRGDNNEEVLKVGMRSLRGLRSSIDQNKLALFFKTRMQNAAYEEQEVRGAIDPYLKQYFVSNYFAPDRVRVVGFEHGTLHSEIKIITHLLSQESFCQPLVYVGGSMLNCYQCHSVIYGHQDLNMNLSGLSANNRSNTTFLTRGYFKHQYPAYQYAEQFVQLNPEADLTRPLLVNQRNSDDHDLAMAATAYLSDEE